jgi:hypothetical protein
MAKCIFENLSPEQAVMLAEWFEGQGEQDCIVWFEENDIEAPLTDVGRDGGYMEVENSGDVTVYCRSL